MKIFITIAAIFALESEIHGEQTPTFHIELTPEERKHYFGTKFVDDVPPYQYTSPQPIDRRRKRGTDYEVVGSNTDYLEYTIEAFGQTIHLHLRKNKHMISPGCVVQHFLDNGTRQVYPCTRDELDCFYTGRTSNHSDSWVAASVCDGMHAVIGLPEKTMVVQPIKNKRLTRIRKETAFGQRHIVYQLETKNRFCETHVNKQKMASVHTTKRRRSTSRRYVETAIVVDPLSYNFHGDDTEKMAKTVMNIVAQRFLDPSLNSELYFTLNRVIILQQEQAGLIIQEDSGNTLHSFCEWQSIWNPADDSDPEHVDYVVLLTKIDLKYFRDSENVGLATKGICGLKTKCSVNEDTGLGTGLTIAHETGHVLGINHDSDGNPCPDLVNIMSSQSVSGPNAFKWSNCSASSLETFLSSPESKCLNDGPPASADHFFKNGTKPGTIFSANRQCRLLLGQDAKSCENVRNRTLGQNVCAETECQLKQDSGGRVCITYSFPKMDGTECGNRQWCVNAMCVDMGHESPDPINGGWSSWESKFSICSRTCGGGVKVRRRFCNNPEPMYGGHQCSGTSIIAELCNMQECTTSQYQFWQEQCAAKDNVTTDGPHYHWTPYTNNLKADDLCKVPCVVEGTNLFSSRGISIDGTECITDNSSALARCVGGSCKVFGCDGHIDSNKVFDNCGVCHGRGNTCKKVFGSFRKGNGQQFTTFVEIPTGSTGITISQRNNYCYLSLLVNGLQLFSENTIRLSRTYTIGGIIAKYQKIPERLEILGPTKAPVSVQVYRQFGDSYLDANPDVYYEYHTPTTKLPTSYMWKIKAGECSKTCGNGMYFPMITCENAVTGIVEDYFCDINQKPLEFPHPCNMHACPPKWRYSQWSECSKNCSGGLQERLVECVQEIDNWQAVVSDRMCQGQTKLPSSSSCNTEKCPGAY